MGDMGVYQTRHNSVEDILLADVEKALLFLGCLGKWQRLKHVHQTVNNDGTTGEDIRAFRVHDRIRSKGFRIGLDDGCCQRTQRPKAQLRQVDCLGVVGF